MLLTFIFSEGPYQKGDGKVGDRQTNIHPATVVSHLEEEYERQEVGKDNKEVKYCCEWNVEKSEYISAWETWRNMVLPDNDKKCNANRKKWQNNFEEEQESHQKRIEDMNER